MVKVYDIDSAISKETYQVFIPQHIAKTIQIWIDDGYGSSIDSHLSEGFYTAYCYHNIHAIGKPKYWEILNTESTCNAPETDSKEIKGIHIQDLKDLMGIGS